MNVGKKLLIIMEKPTQFDAPFFQFIATHEKEIILHVAYANFSNNSYDSELGKSFSWGIDTESGYSWDALPSKGWLSALFRLIKSQDYLLISGYSHPAAAMAYLFCYVLHRRCAIRLDTVGWRNRSGLKVWLFKKPLFWLLSQICSHFLANGSLTRSYLIGLGIAPSRIRRFPYIVDNDWFKQQSTSTHGKRQALRHKLGIPAEHRIVLAVSKLNAREAPVDLVQAFRQLSTLNQVTLLIVGDGDQADVLRRQAGAMSTERQLVFAGHIPYTSLPAYYAIADVFVHAARDEPWGVSVQEAMACGLPVITSDYVGAGYDLIQPGENGFMYSYGNPQQLAEYIDQALNWNRDAIIDTNQNVLKEWNYQTIWQELKALIIHGDTTP